MPLMYYGFASLIATVPSVSVLTTFTLSYSFIVYAEFSLLPTTVVSVCSADVLVLSKGVEIPLVALICTSTLVFRYDTIASMSPSRHKRERCYVCIDRNAIRFIRQKKKINDFDNINVIIIIKLYAEAFFFVQTIFLGNLIFLVIICSIIVNLNYQQKKIVGD